jgi:hypothetical protein
MLACSPGVGCAVTDLVSSDFDGDGNADLLFGGQWQADAELRLGKDEWAEAVTIEQMSAADFEVGDIDKDGVDDVVAQREETIADFPAQTDVWLATPGAAARFSLVQTIYNHDNHNDNSALADANGDGCLDYLHIGVDMSQVAIRFGNPTAGGCSSFLGEHDSSASADVGWTTFPGLSGTVGIQQLDANGDGSPEWIHRARPQHLPGNYAIYHFTSIPQF